MSDVQSLPIEVTNEEDIARVVFSPLMVEDGEVSPSAFQLRDLHKPEDYVSVIRHNIRQKGILYLGMLCLIQVYVVKSPLMILRLML